MPNKIKFPEGFLIGGAVSAEQTEGHGITRKARTVYDILFRKSPQNFYNQVGPAVTTDTMTNYKNDIKMWKEIGINSHRTSISWSRIFPDGMDKPRNEEAIKWYHEFFDEMIKNDIKPIVNLYHFDMPGFAHKIGGFESRKMWDWFEKYSIEVLEEFSPKIQMWTTMNEPWVPVHLGYLGVRQLPQVIDPQRASNAANGVIMCHAKAVNYFNEKIKTKYPKSEIGAIFNSTIVYPRDKNNPEDVKAALYASLYSSTGLTDPMVIGKWRPEIIEWVKELGVVPENYQKGDLEELSKVKVDFVGLNFYAPQRAKSPDPENKKSKNVFMHYFSTYDLPNKRENKFRNWEIYPKGVYDTLMMYSERYGKDKKYMLTEYGMGVQNEGINRDENGIIQDDYRISFIKEHLMWLNKAMQEGLNVIGAHLWATHDCWSWDNGFKNTYGLIEVDLKNQSRKFKKSALWHKEWAKTLEFNDDFPVMEETIDISKYNIIESKVYDPLNDLKKEINKE